MNSERISAHSLSRKVNALASTTTFAEYLSCKHYVQQSAKSGFFQLHRTAIHCTITQKREDVKDSLLKLIPTGYRGSPVTNVTLASDLVSTINEQVVVSEPFSCIV